MTADEAPKLRETDPHVRTTTIFADPEHAFRSMAYIQEAVVDPTGLLLVRHSDRRARNAHRVAMVQERHLLSRSVDGRGSEQAARVAAMRSMGPPNALDLLLGQAPTEAEPERPGLLTRLRGNGGAPE
ncbi:MAG TPA: hypothetical protein VI997_11575 [Candidatus Thermoplasmatota archaeon]|nr:hypothetical protein [Candidatus Thermoplasmatota archaeon]